MQEIIFEIKYFERGLSKTFKKLAFFFLSNPVPFNWQNYQKQKGSDTSDQSLLRLRNKFKNISLFIIYYCLTKLDDVIKTSFWAIPKITSANLCKSVDDIVNYSTSICLFETVKCGKEGKKCKNLNILRTKKAF